MKIGMFGGFMEDASLRLRVDTAIRRTDQACQAAAPDGTSVRVVVGALKPHILGKRFEEGLDAFFGAMVPGKRSGVPMLQLQAAYDHDRDNAWCRWWTFDVGQLEKQLWEVLPDVPLAVEDIVASSARRATERTDREAKPVDDSDDEDVAITRAALVDEMFIGHF
jgi:hypothetical protein